MKESIKKLIIKFDDLSLSYKLILPFSFLVFILSIVIYFYFPQKFEEVYFDSLQDKAKSIGEISAFSMSSALYFQDNSAIDDEMHGLLLLHDISYIVITDNQGHILGKHNLKLANECQYKDIFEDSKTLINNVYKTRHEVHSNLKVIGYLYIGISVDEMIIQSKQSKKTIASISVIIFLIGLLFVFLISYLLIAPLKRFKVSVDKIREGDLSLRLKIKSNNEIGQLARAFNKMIKRLETSHKSLKEEIKMRRDTEIALKQARDEMEFAFINEKELNKLKSKFVSMVSHEYRTPLTVILSSTYLLELFFKKNAETEFIKQIDKIRISVHNMTALLEDVLFLNKKDLNKLETKKEHINPNIIISETIKEIEAINNYSHKIIFETENPDLEVYIQKTLFNHIILNLLTNGIKFSPQKTDIMVELYDKETVFIIKVSDHGIGIPEESLGSIFEPFYRGENVGQIQGTGVGMSIVKDCIASLKGEIHVESQLNVGTSFVTIFPKLDIG
ncbi:MAG: ATP-binding protein [Candidatus Kapabacteria bacterium]|nr:ATP-binding protein [Candidatus Kapabacteria bacterium]